MGRKGLATCCLSLHPCATVKPLVREGFGDDIAGKATTRYPYSSYSSTTESARAKCQSHKASRRKLAVIGFWIGSAFSAACHGRSPVEPSARPAVPLAASDWTLTYQIGGSLVTRAASGSGSGFVADFPTASTESLNAALVTVNRQADPGQTVTATWQVECDPGAGLNAAIPPGAPGADSNPATATLILTGPGVYPNVARYYAGRTVLVCGARQSVTVPLEPESWSGVNGAPDPAGFSRLLAGIGNVGIGFGGAYISAHGDQAVGGRVRFLLGGYSIQ